MWPFNWLKLKSDPRVWERRRAPTPLMDDVRLAKALVTFNKAAWGLRSRLRDDWVSIPKVKVTTRFMGWGYVDGRDKGLKINSRLVLTEADDDMDFTEYCAVLDGVPTLLILRRGPGVTVTIIAERDFLADVLNTAAMRMDTIEQFKATPEPVQRVMNDILDKVLTLIERQAETRQEPIEKLLSY